MFTESRIGSAEDVEKAKSESSGLGLFVRSLVGLDRQATKNALGVFLTSSSLNSDQTELLEEIVNHLTEHGCMDASRVYEFPYTNFHSYGVEGVFNPQQVSALISILEDVRSRAIA